MQSFLQRARHFFLCLKKEIGPPAAYTASIQIFRANRYCFVIKQKRFVYIVCMSGGGSKTNDGDSSGSSCCSGGSMKQETLQWWKKEATAKKKEGADQSKHASSTACQGPISPKSSHGNQQHASSPTKLEPPSPALQDTQADNKSKTSTQI